ncbi:MAG: 4Fe-4S dicluster domain-containing protein [Candidatus Hodarchaeales archaeon]|jgi:ferredoxin
MSFRTFLEESYKGWKLVRKCIASLDELELIEDKCASCDFCTLICPREALSFEHDQNGARKRLVVNSNECSFCGYCVAFCPFHALELRSNKKQVIPVVEQGVCYPLVRQGQVEVIPEDAVEKCPSCYICVVQCPQQAISLKLMDGIPRLLIDYSKCAGCRSCRLNCPVCIIKSYPAFEGTLEVDLDQAQQFGSELAKICPMACFAMDDDGVLSHSDDACVFCGACQYLPGAPRDMIVVRRTNMLALPPLSTAVIDEIKKAFLTF